MWFKNLVGLCCLVVGVLPWACEAAGSAKRPNFVWIVSEDNSLHYLKHFFPGGVATPNIEALAAGGLTFDNAYSNSPVCSVARTTLATSVYAPKMGTQFHRAYSRVALPEGARLFHEYLREAGYYTSNNVKTDYNVKLNKREVWDDSSRKASWRNRDKADRPFFHMETHAQSHEGSLHFSAAFYEKEAEAMNLDSVQLADYFPDTRLFRYTHARYQQRIQRIDELVGKTVEKLRQDGLLEDTFVFYFSDHGGVLPRGKGYLYESGLHIPLVVRIPKNFRHLVDAEVGDRIDGTVEFVDFGPTLLKLAGVEAPSHFDGKAFLGQGISTGEINSRDESFGYADRFDEKYDLVRSLKKGRFHYIRNYQPYLPNGLQNNYRYKMLAYQQWRDLYKAGELTEIQRRFFEPKTVEALYDVEQDPHEVNNLADDPKYAHVLNDLRERLRKKIKSLPDLGFYPESYLAKHAFSDVAKFSSARKAEIATLVDVADLSLLPFADARPKLEKALLSDNPLVRFWAVSACAAFGKQAEALAGKAMPLLSDKMPNVRIRTAEFLGGIHRINPQPVLAEVVNTTRDPILATEALNAVAFFHDFFGQKYRVSTEHFKPLVKGQGIAWRLAYIAGSDNVAMK